MVIVMPNASVLALEILSGTSFQRWIKFVVQILLVVVPLLSELMD